MEQPKHKYCRYCARCIAQDEENAVCEAKNEWVTKRTIRDGCQEFDFCQFDAFYINNPEDAVYRPREPKKKQYDGQIALVFE